MNLRRASLLVVPGLAVAVLAGLALRPTPAPPNVLLISIDTLRHDALGHAGHDRGTTPHLDHLASRSTVFTHAYSQSGWTLPSMATVMTGEYPVRHGATQLHLQVDPHLPVLAERLAARGYDTAGFVSHLLLTGIYGLDRGFASFDDDAVGLPPTEPGARFLSDRVIGRMEDLEEPFFAWVHYFDPHFPYLEHAGWADLGDGDRDRYDQEVAYTDAEIGRVLAALEAAGRLDRTVIVVLSDHGEEFGEHGGRYHHTLHEEVQRIPLLVHVPGRPPARVDRPVGQIDLLPTLAALTGLEADPALPGRDLLAPGPWTDLPVIAERDRPPGFRIRSTIAAGYKLIVTREEDDSGLPERSRGTLHEPVNVHPGIALYDLTADPGELRNLATERGALADSLRAILAAHEAVRGNTSPEAPLSEEMRERLRSLGYAN